MNQARSQYRLGCRIRVAHHRRFTVGSAHRTTGAIDPAASGVHAVNLGAVKVG
jgi:hypothetical protein